MSPPLSLSLSLSLSLVGRCIKKQRVVDRILRTRTTLRTFLQRRKKVMAVAVSRDLTVQVLEDANAVKLTDRQQVLRAAVQRGEPKCLGVSQVMLGLMVMSYSIPLHVTEFTEVVTLGVPWWSGLMFITAGVVAIYLDKHCTMKTLHLCLMVSVVSTVLSVAAVIIYSVDIDKSPVVTCVKVAKENCTEKDFALRLSRGLKSSLLLFTLAQTAISAVLSFLLFRQRRSFGQYTSLSHAAPSTPESLIPPNLH
ncbi:transmembrane protein 176 [Hippoglossus stenolepis]|uniref:transmembrane protein 176 n=1 Tax=Hippoglossus stenolepis TaxID=195615 RepID=UPI001FAF3B67|nr:transmembrane protein 176 [Hippoglossus stenolepis]